MPLAALLELAEVLVLAEPLPLTALQVAAWLGLTGLAGLRVLSSSFATVLASLPPLGCCVPRRLCVRPASNWRNNIGAGVATSERAPTIDGIFFFGAGAE